MNRNERTSIFGTWFTCSIKNCSNMLQPSSVAAHPRQKRHQVADIAKILPHFDEMGSNFMFWELIFY